MRAFALAYPKTLVGTFYRRHAWGCEIPPTGGLLIYTNHVNGLMDADMPLYLTDRQQFFLAKPSLFRIPGLSWVIRTVGAIPIYRQKDRVDMSKNEESFREIHRVLREGGAIALYPEGESRLGFRTRPFKTGAARMVLGAQVPGGAPIRLVPVALLYEEQEVFLSRVHLWVGEAFDLLPFMERYEIDSRQTVRDATTLLQERLDELSVPVEDLHTFSILLNADRIRSSSALGTAPRVRALAIAWQAWCLENPSAAQRLGARLIEFGRSMEALGLEARDLRDGGWPRSIGPRVRYALSLLLTLLLSPILAPPIALSWWIAHLGRSTPDKLVTVTVIATSVLVPVWGIGFAYLLTGYKTGFPGFWSTLLAVWGMGYVARRLSLAWTRPRPLRRALTGLGLIGRKSFLNDLWKRKIDLQTELDALFPRN